MCRRPGLFMTILTRQGGEIENAGEAELEQFLKF